MPPKSVKEKRPSDQELSQDYNKQRQELQQIIQKAGQLEKDAEEHALVIETLKDAKEKNPDRKCFRLVGGVLVELTVKDVLPALETNLEGITSIVSDLMEQYRKKEEEHNAFKEKYNIQVRPANSIA